jgi:hypothetical protein
VADAMFFFIGSWGKQSGIHFKKKRKNLLNLWLIGAMWNLIIAREIPNRMNDVASLDKVKLHTPSIHK